MNIVFELKRRIEEQMQELAEQSYKEPICVAVIEETEEYIKFEENENLPAILACYISILESDYHTREDKLKVCQKALHLKVSPNRIDQNFWRILGNTVETYLAWAKKSKV